MHHHDETDENSEHCLCIDCACHLTDNSKPAQFSRLWQAYAILHSIRIAKTFKYDSTFSRFSFNLRLLHLLHDYALSEFGKGEYNFSLSQWWEANRDDYESSAKSIHWPYISNKLSEFDLPSVNSLTREIGSVDDAMDYILETYKQQRENQKNKIETPPVGSLLN